MIGSSASKSYCFQHIQNLQPILIAKAQRPWLFTASLGCFHPRASSCTHLKRNYICSCRCSTVSSKCLEGSLDFPCFYQNQSPSQLFLTNHFKQLLSKSSCSCHDGYSSSLWVTEKFYWVAVAYDFKKKGARKTIFDLAVIVLFWKGWILYQSSCILSFSSTLNVCMDAPLHTTLEINKKTPGGHGNASSGAVDIVLSNASIKKTTEVSIYLEHLSDVPPTRLGHDKSWKVPGPPCQVCRAAGKRCSFASPHHERPESRKSCFVCMASKNQITAEIMDLLWVTLFTIGKGNGKANCTYPYSWLSCPFILFINSYVRWLSVCSPFQWPTGFSRL